VRRAPAEKWKCQDFGKKKFGRPNFELLQFTIFVARPQQILSQSGNMGTHKKEANRKERQGKTGDGMGNVRVKGENFYRFAFLFHSPVGYANWYIGPGRKSRS
jgi:hypothetical protein